MQWNILHTSDKKYRAHTHSFGAGILKMTLAIQKHLKSLADINIQRTNYNLLLRMTRMLSIKTIQYKTFTRDCQVYRKLPGAYSDLGGY